MRRFRNNKKRDIPSKYVLYVLTAVCVIMFLVSLIVNIEGGPLKNLAGSFFVPMQKGINQSGIWLKDKANDFKTLSEVLEENKRLQEQVDALTEQINNNKLKQYELDNYRELLALDSQYEEYDKIAAHVIARDTENWFSTFTIDKGRKDGIESGMNVIAGCGLVGLVTDVGDHFAKVRSIIDDTSNVSAMVLTTKDNFTISGSLQLMNEEKLLPFSELRDEQDEVKLGDPVVTSYVSDRYKQGILIGYIYSIEENSNHLTKSGTITPVVDFLHLQEVLVITQIKDTGEKDLKNNAIIQE